MCTAINKPFNCFIGDKQLTNTWGFIVNQNVLHNCNAPESQILINFIDAESIWGKTIHRMLNGADYLDMEDVTTPEVCGTILPQNYASLSDGEVRIHIDAFLNKVFLPHLVSIPAERDDRILKAMEFVDQHLNQKLLLEHVAEKIFLSPERTRHFFVEQTGMPFSQYLLWKRIRSISYITVKDKVSPAIVCVHFGFTDYSHFSRIFKRIFGVSPNLVYKACRIVL